MERRKVFILLGHEDKETFSGVLALHYEKGARSAGHEVRRTNIGDIRFDPILHRGYKVIQELEPDLKKIQEDIRWANHIVIFYPMWWSSMPAILKGLFDRMWLSSFAFHFHHDGMGWDKLLQGRSARVVVTMDSWPIIERFLLGDSTNEISRGILGFAGIYPVHIKKIGPVKTMSVEIRNRWLDTMHKWGERGE